MELYTLDDIEREWEVVQENGHISFEEYKALWYVPVYDEYVQLLGYERDFWPQVDRRNYGEDYGRERVFDE